ncbi:MAG: helix-turn-helix domain-containing protein [Candidatus Acidiferrales bacterium]
MRPQLESEFPLLFTIPQAAKVLSLSVRTVERLVFRRELVSRKIGGATRIPRDSLIAFCRKDHETGNHGKEERLDQ